MFLLVLFLASRGSPFVSAYDGIPCSGIHIGYYSVSRTSCLDVILHLYDIFSLKKYLEWLAGGTLLLKHLTARIVNECCLALPSSKLKIKD